MASDFNMDNKSKRNKEQGFPSNKPPGISGLAWFYLFIFIVFVIVYMFGNAKNTKEISWQQFEKEMLKNNDVEKIEIINNEIAEIYIRKDRLKQDKYKDVARELFGDVASEGPQYYINIGSVDSFEHKLEMAQKDVPDVEKTTVVYSKRKNWIANILAWILPIALIMLFWVFLLRRMGGGPGGNPIFNFGKSTAKLFDREKTSNVSFEDVAGLEEAKIEVKEIVDFLKDSQSYTKLGAKIPKGILLVGPTGTGKTLLVRAVAGEANVPFFSLSGSEFVEMFVGVGASRVRDLFSKAKENAPSIIFIDEIDAVGRSRGKAQSYGYNDERESTLNQLLAEMDGFGINTGVIVLAATNRVDVLDQALLRPGRFDRHIYLELPSLNERKEIFKVHLKRIKLAQTINLDLLASQTPGLSGADIANVCNEAALIAARNKKEAVDNKDIIAAMDRIIGGIEKKSTVISAEEKNIIAFHESGHAVVSWLLKNVDPLSKVSIVPRGKSLGASWYLPEEHKIRTETQLFDLMCATLGGRAAEDVIFNEISSGALDDLEKVTKQAYTMVAVFGLNEKIGNVSFYDSSGGQEYPFQKPYSEETASLIDKEVRKLIERAYQTTKEIILSHKTELSNLAEILLKKEVVYKEDLEKILGKRPLERVTLLV